MEDRGKRKGRNREIPKRREKGRTEMHRHKGEDRSLGE
jgi:hypothetical protein